MSKQKDCFAFMPEHEHGPEHCNALTSMVCAKGKCPFYKPENRYDLELDPSTFNKREIRRK